MTADAMSVLPWAMGMFILQICIGLTFIYLSKVTYERTGVGGWRMLRFVGYIMVPWSFLAVVTHVLVPTRVMYVHGTGLLLVSIAFTLMAVKIAEEYLHAGWSRFTVRYTIWCITLAVAAARIIAGGREVTFESALTTLHIAAPFILLPAVYATYRVHQESGTRISMALLGSTVSFLGGHILNLYASGTCTGPGAVEEFERCFRYLYEFQAAYQLPASEYLIAASVGAPVMFFTAFILWTYGQYMLYHHTVLRQYILSAVSSIGETVNVSAIKRIVAKANQNIPEVALRFQGNRLEIYSAEPITWSTVRKVENKLISEFGQYVVPEKRSEAEEAVESIHRQVKGEKTERILFDQSTSGTILCPLQGDNWGQPQMGARELILVGLVVFSAVTFAAVWLR